MHFGSKLTQSVKESNTLYFTFDASGAAMAVLYNGTSYYYVTNIQGDVIAILDTSGTAVVEYAYDAWGNIILTTGSMAGTLGAHNPLRYRGYVYDKETGFYYLQSRYYNPEVGRFINADALVATGQGLLGNNMFAYCGNNPVRRRDASGTTCEEIFGDESNLLDNDELIHGGTMKKGSSSGNNSPSGNGGRSFANGSSRGATPSASQGGKVSSNSVAMDPSDALDTAIDYLGPGYAEAYPPGSGRFISADGLRQVRIGYSDLVGAHAGAPHMNFDLIGHSGSFHVYLLIR